mgnify:CR=1 FL=1
MRIGILGFAHGHVDIYCQRWRSCPDLDIEVASGWDHAPARAARARDQHKIELAACAKELVGRRDLDAVVIAAETAFHCELVELAAAAGKAIVLQKPLALTMAEADRIVDAVRRAGVPFTLAWQMRVDPQNLEMKRLVGSGVLGKLFMVRRRHGLPTHRWPNFDTLWHVKPEMNRDIWADDAAHAIDFIYWLLGEPESVTAEIDSLLNPKVLMDNGIAIYRYPGGPIAEVVCSFTCLAGENTTEIVGERGVVIQNYGDVPSCNVPRPSNAVGLKWFLQGENAWTHSPIASPAGHGERIAALAGPLAEFLHGRRAAIATAEEGRTVLKMTLACYDSVREGRRISMA